MFRSFLPALASAAALLAAGAAHSAILTYTASMLGSNEVPATASLATGFTIVTIDDVLNTMEVNVSFSGLTTPASAAHIHCCAPEGTNTAVAVPFPTFPNATSGTYDHLFNLLDASIYNPAFLSGLGGGTAVGAENALLTGLADGFAYSNIHNTVFPGGEIRGFLTAATTTAVPEPATWALMLLGFGAIGAGLRQRRGTALG